MGTTRAAIVLFVDVDEEDVPLSNDLDTLVRMGLHQAGFDINNPLPVTIKERVINIRIVDTMEAGLAMGNGYLWTEVTTKAYTQRGIYTDKQQDRMDASDKWEEDNKDGNS